MLSLTTIVVGEASGRLRSESGINLYLQEAALAASVEMPPLEIAQVVEGQMALEIAEKMPMRYPQVYVYCERLSNSLKEKFRTFSGTARLVIEARASHDRANSVEPHLQAVVDSVTSVLDAVRGEWRVGMFYAGGYEVAYSPVKGGGRHYVKAAKISFDVEISLN